VATVIAEKAEVISRIDALQQALATLPPDPSIERALYHCNRLRMAVRSSHNEGTRFAAFTVAKIVRDLGPELPPAVPALMQEIRGSLEAMGLDLSK
jgi:hypothetical protein